MDTSQLKLQDHGIEIKSGLVSNLLMQAVIYEIENSDKLMPKYGIRNADKKFPTILNIIQSQEIFKEATRILESPPQLVRCIFFDKTPEKNWLVTWHQDKTVALNNKFHLHGWGPWSIKDGIHHVQPPLHVLNNMITFRIHLDSADDRNGCLKVIPRSHCKGILRQQEITEMVEDIAPVSCLTEAGDTVIMRPHILHSSSKAIVASHRRVIHLEFSSFALPSNISWA